MSKRAYRQLRASNPLGLKYRPCGGDFWSGRSASVRLTGLGVIVRLTLTVQRHRLDIDPKVKLAVNVR